MPRGFKPPRMNITANTEKSHVDKLATVETSTKKKSTTSASKPAAPVAKAPAIKKVTPSTDSKKDTSSSQGDMKRKRSSSFKVPEIASDKKMELEKKATNNASSVKKKYFSCMWTKVSNKKHKTYADGFFVVEEKKFLLLDQNAKQIARDFTGGPKRVKTGDAYIIQNKEIELMEEISADDFESGRCFMNQSAAPVKPLKTKKKKITSTFKAHESVDSSKLEVRAIEKQTAPEGCVLLNPGHPEQDSDGNEIHDVWIDRFLSRVLHPHQEDGIRFMFECASGKKEFTGNGAVLADEMGLGKTLQALALFHTLLSRGPYGKPMIKKAVIVTNSSLVGNWKNEVKKWLSDARCKPLVVTAKSAKQDPEETINSFRTGFHPLLIISYGLAMKFANQINKANPGLLICDEGHKLKNSEIKVVKALKNISTPRRFILTGTPIQNNLQEFFCIIDFINPHVFGGDANRFKHLFDTPISKAREPNATEDEKATGLARARELNRIVSQFILRRTSKIISKHLPPKTEMIVFCKMADLQRDLYQKFLKSSYVHALLTSMERSNALSCIQTLKKLLAHPNMITFKNTADEEESDEEGAGDADNIDLEELGSGKKSPFPVGYNFDKIDPQYSGKLHLLVNMLKKMKEIGDNVVVVSYFTSILDLVQRVLDDLGFTYCRMDGKTNQSKRTEIVETFNSKHNQSFCFLLSSKTGGAGHNLIGANRLIIFDCDWNPANDAQAMARVWRHGQKKDVYIYRFIATGTVEEKILQRQMVKTGLSKMTVDDRHNRAAFSKEFLKELFCFTDDEFCETYESEAEETDFMKEIKKMDPLLYMSGKETGLLTFVKVSSENDYDDMQIEDESGADDGIVTIELQEEVQQEENDSDMEEETNKRPRKKRKTTKS